jgi:ABC-2 type transport system ATP-binding protein
MLKLLAGIYVPTEGQVHVRGSLTPFIELGVGFNPELTGRENVYLNGALLGFNRKEMRAMYKDIVDFAELKRFMDQKLKNYSSGMQVRLAFSIAIRAQSDILLIDEVLAVGDAAFQKKCFDYFMQLKKNNRTVVLVTHDMGAVRQYCDRAIMINEGKIIKEGSPEQVAQAYQRFFTDEIKHQSRDNARAVNVGSHWGSGKMLCLKPEVKVSRQSISLTCRYRALQDVPPPILGFTIYGPAGNNILEGNTLRQKHKTQDMKKGQETEINWTIPNMLASGSYSLSVACCDQSATDFYDWFNDAESFDIVKEGFTAGVADPPLTINAYRIIKT